jgi:uncharacterized membrane protein
MQPVQYCLQSVSENEAQWIARPNRSLTRRGRTLWLFLFGLNAFLVSAVAIAIGAWPIVPFAGIEVGLLAVAFWLIGRRDDDVERLTIHGTMFRWQQVLAGRRSEQVGNLVWARCAWVNVAGRVGLRVQHAGQSFVVGETVGNAQELRRLAAFMGVRSSCR